MFSLHDDSEAPDDAPDRPPALRDASRRLGQDVAGALEAARSADVCAAIGRRLVRAIEAEFDALRADGAAVACAAGCTFCCHQRVGVLPHEAVALWVHLRRHARTDEVAAIEARIASNARAIDRMTDAEHRAANLRCAFLVDGRCSAYDVRPSACASYHSLRRARCEYAFDHPQDVGTPRASRPALRELRSFARAATQAVEAGFREAGLSTAKGELHQLLRAIIEDPGAIDRWLAGEEMPGV